MSYWHFPVDFENKKEVDDFKERIEALGIRDATYDEVLKVLLRKNKKFTLSSEEIREMFRQMRGVL